MNHIFQLPRGPRKVLGLPVGCPKEPFKGQVGGSGLSDGPEYHPGHWDKCPSATERCTLEKPRQEPVHSGVTRVGSKPRLLTIGIF